MSVDKVRYILIISLCTLLFSYLFFVLYKLQISGHDKYYSIKKEQNEYVSKESKRGAIYATLKNGELMPIAEDEVFYKLVLSPKDIPTTYEDRLFIVLKNIIEIDQDTFFNKIKNKKDSYEEIKVISKEEKEKIEELALPGVLTYETYKRKYSMGNVGGRIIGFVGGGDDGFVGRYGLEKYYENDLQSKNDAKVSFFTKIFETKSDEIDVKLSKNIVTSIEPNVMQFLNKTLLDMKETWGADEVSAIVMEVETGKIIAMETVPEFDPNNYKEFEIKNFVNPSVQGVYELGSIMKPITLSGAIEKGLISATTTYHDYGFVKVDNYTIKNFDEKVRGIQTMQDVISNSLNTGAVYVQKLLGRVGFKENFEEFGFVESTRIDFPGEVSNQTGNLDDSERDVNFATAAFGQGVAVTPISMLSALNIIPNYGRKTCPHFLDYQALQNGQKIFYECTTDDQQVISTTTAKEMNNMMVELIEHGLAGGKYADDNYKVGAKTGTAQLPSPDGKYYKDKFIHSYFAYFPAEKPKYSVLIYQVNPKKGMLASMTLAPSASKIKDFLLTYFNIPPDR
jgi:cell division protein FtsI/penicillin-binding protein 2